MPEKRNTLYTLDEVAEVIGIYTSLAYAKVAVDTISEEKDLKVRSATLRNIVDCVIPRYYNVQLKIRKMFRNLDIQELEEKCKNLLS